MDLAAQAAADSPRISSDYEIGNALGRLNADKPLIAQRCIEHPEYARIVRWVLNAIDGWQDRSGEPVDMVGRLIRHGKIEVRCVGNRITIVVPG